MALEPTKAHRALVLLPVNFRPPCEANGLRYTARLSAPASCTAQTFARQKHSSKQLLHLMYPSNKFGIATLCLYQYKRISIKQQTDNLLLLLNNDVHWLLF